MQYQALKVELRQSMEKPLVTNPKFQDFIDELYRPNAKIGSGSTAETVRQELKTGLPVGDKYTLRKRMMR